MEQLTQLTADFSSAVWGLPLLILLIGGGLYLLIRSRFETFRLIGHAFQVLSGRYDDPNDLGQISHFQALTTALSSTIGMGNIAGVAVAISIGGPGAIFWMWVSAIVGMSTKFFTSTLAIMFRGKDSAGVLQGGPMYFIMEGLGKSWKPLAIMFSICGLVGALPVFNVNQLTQAINDILLTPNGVEVGLTSNLTIGLVLVSLTAVVILGGIGRISKIASKIVFKVAVEIGKYSFTAFSVRLGTAFKFSRPFLPLFFHTQNTKHNICNSYFRLLLDAFSFLISQFVSEYC